MTILFPSNWTWNDIITWLAAHVDLLEDGYWGRPEGHCPAWIAAV